MNKMKKLSLMLCAAIACALFLSPAVFAQESQSPFKVAIGKIVYQLQGHIASVEINLLKADFEFSGFDFRIAFEKNVFDPVDVTPGLILDSCGWEYFTYRLWPEDSANENYSSGILRIIGLASPDGNPVLCSPFEGSTLATMNFMVTDDRNSECTVWPISFYWTGCGDNKIYSQYGDSIFISNRVYGYVDSAFHDEEITKDTLLPTYTGAPSICDSWIPENYDKAVLRSVDFVNGYVDIICTDSIDIRGDINLNGIPYEIADWIIFVNYFMLCNYDAFTINAGEQIAATEINYDGYPLTVEDLVYLIRIITGEALPPTTPPDDTVYQGYVSIEDGYEWMSVGTYSGIPLGALYMSFYLPNTDIDTVFLLEDASHMELGYNICYDTLNVLVYSLEPGESVPVGNVQVFEINYSGERPHEVAADAAGYNAEAVDVSIVGYISNRGDLNLDGIANSIADAVLYAQYFTTCGLEAFIINPEEQVAASDVNADELFLTIEDFVYMLRRILGDFHTFHDTAYSGIILHNFQSLPQSPITVRSILDIPAGGMYFAYYLPDTVNLPQVNFLEHGSQMDTSWEICQDSLKILLYSLTPLAMIPAGHADLFEIEYTGEMPELAAAEIAGYYGEIIDAVVIDTSGDFVSHYGDLNLNGISFELSDAEIFLDYLDYGLSAFDINLPAQVNEGDIDRDHIPLTNNDFDAIMDIINFSPVAGECSELQPDSTFNGTATILNTGTSLLINSQFDAAIGGVTFAFRIDDYGTYSTNADDYLLTDDKLLISMPGCDTCVENEFEIYYTGAEPELIDAWAIGYCMESVNLEINYSSELVPFAFAIDIVEDIAPGNHSYIDVTKQTGSQKIYGFDFLIGFDFSAMIFTGANAGELFDEDGDYQWEYFTYRYAYNGDCGENCPGGLVRAVAISDINDGAHHSLSTSVPDGMVLFTLDFLITNDMNLACTYNPIRFYWIDCGDNSVATSGVYNDDSTYTQAMLSRYVYDRYPDSSIEISDGLAGFPTYYGAADSCLDGFDPSQQPVVRFVDYYNGGVGILCDSVPCNGDVNLNGIAYEIADAVIYQNYFLYGLAAFAINEAAQICESDINRDGQAPAIEDFVYLIRIIAGEALPYEYIDTTFNGIVTNIAEDNKITIQTEFDNPAGAVHFIYYLPNTTVNNVLKKTDINHMNMGYHVQNDTLRILVSSFDAGDEIPAGPSPILEIDYTGETPELVSASASGYNGEKVDIEIINIYDIEPFEFAIEIIQDQLMGQNTSVDVIKRAGELDILGFDFLFAYDSYVLSFLGVEQGELFDEEGDYQWEYFTYRIGTNIPCDGDCPGGRLRVVALADINDGAHHPLSTNVPDGTVLFSLNFLVTNDYNYECTFNPVRFFWIDCGDNSVAIPCIHGDTCSNVQLAISQHVYDFDLSEITDLNSGFPTFTGSQFNCVNDTVIPGYENVRLINFFNGGVEIICADSIDYVGDVNLNGIAYEIADAGVFQNYLLLGLSAFTINVAGQTAATDINYDGIPLQIEDYVYLWQIIYGNAVPGGMIDSAFFGEAAFIDVGNYISVVTSFDDSVGAVHMMLSVTGTTIDSVVTTLSLEPNGLGYEISGDTLRILIQSIETPKIPEGLSEILRIYYTGYMPELMTVTASGVNGDKVIISAMQGQTGTDGQGKGGLPQRFELYQNYPNPFNMDTEIKFDLPKHADWQFDIYNITGQRVKSYSGSHPAGTVVVHWDGTDLNGFELSSGIYFYRLQAGQFVSSKKMILLK